MDNRKSSEDLKRRPERMTSNNYFDAKSPNRTRREAPRNMQFDNSRDISSSSNGAVNLMSRSSRNSRRAAKKKINKKLLVTNILLSVALVISSTFFTLLTAALDFGWSPLKNKMIDSGNKTSESGEISFVGSSNPNVAYVLVCGIDLSESLTDIIMVACYDLANNNINVLQIPRDTYVGDVPTGKINAVFGHGYTDRNGKEYEKIQALKTCIYEKFGIPIDYYATVTIKGTENIIDCIGGVDITLDRGFTLVDDTVDPEERKYFEEGKVHFNGQWGTAFIRHRSSYAQGDMGRIKAQRSFYAAVLKKMTSLDFGQITSIVTSAAQDVSSDMSLKQMLGLADKMKDLKLDEVSIMSVPGQSGMYSPTGERLSYYSVHKADLVKMINEYFLPYEEEALVASDIDIKEIHSTSYSDYDDFLQGGSLQDFDSEAEKTTASDDDE